ncbi:hypothetical protein DITRI_Ditri01bG0173200 [Diplodiscus trichospermus]
MKGEEKKRSRGKVPEGDDSQLDALFDAIKRWKKSERRSEDIALFVEKTTAEHEIAVDDYAQLEREGTEFSDLRNVEDHTATSIKEQARRPARPQPCSSSQRPPHTEQKIKGDSHERIMKRFMQFKSSKRKPLQAAKPSSKVFSL